MPVQRNTNPPPRSSATVLPAQREPDAVVAPLPTGAPDTPAAPRQATSDRSRSRLGAAWVGICFGAVVLVLLVVFMMQNTQPVDVSFLGWSGTAPLALTLLIAGVGVGLVALVIGSVRIGQLRHRLTRARKAGVSTKPAVAL